MDGTGFLVAASGQPENTMGENGIPVYGEDDFLE